MEAVSTDKAPSEIGPYSQAVRFGNLLFLSGQIPLDPASGQMTGSTVEEQTHQVLRNLSGVLASQGLSLANLVKTTVFLQRMADFPKFNQVYQGYFQPPYPARATVEVGKLPKDALVEIEGIAYFPG